MYNNSMKKNILLNKDWFESISQMQDNSIDFICIDPPYGKIQGMKLSGQNEGITWDDKIDWKKMFDEFNRIVKPGGTIAVFGQQPTYSEMILSNKKWFKYEYIWSKNNAAQGFHSDKMPLNFSENIAIFIVGETKKNKRTFNKPQPTKSIDKTKFYCRWYAKEIFNFIGLSRRKIHSILGHRKLEFFFYVAGTHFGICSEKLYNDLIDNFKIDTMPGFISYSKLKKIWEKERAFNKGVKLNSSEVNGTFSNILEFAKDGKPYYHPTQKPVKLMEKLIETHSREGDVILDCFAGSGSTLVAARNLKRRFIGVEISPEFCEVIKKRAF